MQRFAQQGKIVSLLDDSTVSAGPVWVFESLVFNENATNIDIGSIALSTDVSSWIYPGCTYCKLLAPSRAVELLQTWRSNNATHD